MKPKPISRQRKTKPVSRKRKYQIENLAAGLCRICPTPRNKYAQFCDAHQAAASKSQAAYRRKAQRLAV